MGVRFSKQIKINNFLKLNISKSGISATVGKKGASVNIGGNGAFLNLSPSAVGIKGTGISYRTKINNPLSGLLKKNDDKSSSLKKEIGNKADDKNNVVTNTLIEQYQKDFQARVSIHKYTDNVITKDEFDNHINEISETAKTIYQLSIDGDEDTIENMIGAFNSELEIGIDVSCIYELEDHQLYVDLDLPEIETIDDTYPVIAKDEIVHKKKTASAIKEEYANIVMSLAVYLSANYFNISSYIDEIIISGFTSVRNKDGDLIDKYLYSVKFRREIFEKTDLSKLDNLLSFFLQFENRINLANNTFKEITPYQQEKVAKKAIYIDDVILALKELGYKNIDDNIVSKLNEFDYQTSEEYLKEALKLMKK